MKVYIGPYRSWIGPYQIASALCFWAKKEVDEHGFKRQPDWVHDFGEWLSEDKDGNDSWLTKFCNWVETKRKRKIKVKLHEYDTWSMDSTLSHIIHPMLIQLKATAHGSGFVDDEDVPEHLRSTAAPPKENEWDNDEHFFKRWDWCLDEMIWAFGELANDKPGEDAFFDHSESREIKDFEESIKKLKVDREGLDAYQARMSNAFRLFGKYYQGLWT